MITTLNDIGLALGTDKASHGHNYLTRYADVLASWCNKPVTLVEIGVWEGASLEMWAQWFTHKDARIIGVDVDLSRINRALSDRVLLKQGDANDDAFLHNIASHIVSESLTNERTLCAVIDDGSHQVAHHKSAFDALWPLLTSGGVYIIEDLHTYWWERANPVNAFAWLSEMAASTVGRGLQRWEYESDIDSITFAQSVVIMKKK
jgi:hypothetical protein